MSHGLHNTKQKAPSKSAGYQVLRATRILLCFLYDSPVTCTALPSQPSPVPGHMRSSYALTLYLLCPQPAFIARSRTPIQLKHK